MVRITELTDLATGDKIYAPKLNKYFIIVDYNYNDVFNGMLANLTLSKENPKENGFTAILSTLIELGYYKC